MTARQHDFVDLRSIVELLRRQVPLISGTALAVMTLALLYLFQATPVYRASALLMVDPSQKNLLDAAEVSTPAAGAETARMESEAAIVRSDRVLLAVIEAGGLMSDPEFGPRLRLLDKLRLALSFGGAPDDPAALTAATLERFTQAVNVRRRAQTYLLEVSVDASDPARAARLANTLSDRYIALQLEDKIDRALGARDLLEAQLDRAQSSLAGSEAELDAYIRRNAAVLSAETGDAALRDLVARVEAAEAARAGRDLIYRQADAALSARDWDQLALQLGNQGVAALNAQRAALLAKLDGTPDEAGTQTTLHDALRTLDGDLARSGQAAVGDLQIEVAGLGRQASELKDDLRRKVLSAPLSAETLTDLYGLQQDAEIARRQYAGLLSRLRDLDAQAVVQLADARVVSEALPPQHPVAPDVTLVLISAAISGLALGVGAALLREQLAGRVVSSGQLTDLVPAPLVASVPWVPAVRGRNSVADLISDAPFSAFSESIRRLRAGLDRAVPRTGRARVFVLCSADPGEGKSSVALALARSYALAGQRTLLIDADLRKPGLARLMGLTPQIGLAEYLGEAQAPAEGEGLCRIDPKSPVGVILGQGQLEATAEELLQSEAFAEVLETARATLDVIVIDTSPLMAVMDAQHLVARADGVVLAVRQAATQSEDLGAAYGQIVAAAGKGVPVVSVLTMDRGTSARRRYAGYYAGYVAG